MLLRKIQTNLLLIALSLSLFAKLAAQNLVPNPGFEDFVGDSLSTHIDQVAHWFNLSRNRQKAPFGTPDFVFLQNPSSKSNYEPHQGHAMCGFITYWARIYNYREYMGVRLSEPLKPKQRYELSFYLSNGKNEGFSSAGTDGIGVLFTTFRPEQKRYEVLSLKPQFISKEIIYTNGWKKVKTTFEADSAYEFLSIGSFLNDYQTLVSTYKDTDDLQAYYFIDDVSLQALSQEPEPEIPQNNPVDTTSQKIEPQAKTEPPSSSNYIAFAFLTENPEQLVLKNQPPDALEGRAVYRQARWHTEEKSLTVYVWDSEGVDGDRVSLKLNQDWICQNQLLTRKKIKYQLNLLPNDANFITLFANSLGTSPPCTVTLLLKTKTESKKIMLRSDLIKCGAIQINQGKSD
jgi:hypothetical protein